MCALNVYHEVQSENQVMPMIAKLSLIQCVILLSCLHLLNPFLLQTVNALNYLKDEHGVIHRGRYMYLSVKTNLSSVKRF